MEPRIPRARTSWYNSVHGEYLTFTFICILAIVFVYTTVLPKVRRGISNKKKTHTHTHTLILKK